MSFISADYERICFIFSSKYFPEHKLPENIIATTDAKAALQGADFCFHAVPVQVVIIQLVGCDNYE